MNTKHQSKQDKLQRQQSQQQMHGSKKQGNPPKLQEDHVYHEQERPETRMTR